jgi:hypothetical protein
MLRSIAAAIISALRSLTGFARRVVAAPFQMLGNIFGGAGDPPAVPPVETPTPDDDEPAPGPNMDLVYKQLANIVMTWAAESVVDGQPRPMPQKFPRELSKWLPGISLDEAYAIISATEAEVSAHLRSRELIHGVRSVRPLEPAVWPKESCPSLERDSLPITCDPSYALAQ